MQGEFLLKPRRHVWRRRGIPPLILYCVTRCRRVSKPSYQQVRIPVLTENFPVLNLIKIHRQFIHMCAYRRDGQGYCKRRSAGVPKNLIKVNTLSTPPPAPLFLVNFRNYSLNPHRCTECWLWVNVRSVLSRGHVHQWACDPQTQSSVNLVPRVLFPDRTATCPSLLTDIQPACLTLPPSPLHLTFIRFQLVSRIGFN